MPSYRTLRNLELESYIESYMTESRKQILKSVLNQRMRHLCLVAENFIDEHNVHAMIRTSECFGLQDFHNIGLKDVIMKKGKSVNRGAFQWTHIFDYSDCEHPTIDCIHHLKSQGYTVYATSSHLEANYTPQSIPINQPLAIIFGKEHEGISQDALDYCDGIVSIPMYGFTESFNVSVAASLIAQPIVSRIRESEIQWNLEDAEKEQLYYEWIWYSVKQPNIFYKEWCVNNSKEIRG